MTRQSPTPARVGGVLAILAVVGLSAACSIRWVDGQGPITSETRQIAAFMKFEADHGIDVDVRVGSAQSVEVHAQANVLPLVTTAVRGDTLRITGTAEFRSPTRPQVVIVVPALEAIDLGGGSQGVVAALAAGTFGLHISGGAGISMTGTIDTLAIDGSGGASAHLPELLVRAAAVDLSGGTQVTVNASEIVTGDLNGGAHLTVLGDPQIVVDASFGGVVERG